jgi:hypothetical protein
VLCGWNGESGDRLFGESGEIDVDRSEKDEERDIEERVWMLCELCTTCIGSAKLRNSNTCNLDLR